MYADHQNEKEVAKRLEGSASAQPVEGHPGSENN